LLVGDNQSPVRGGQVEVGEGKCGQFGDFLLIVGLRARGNEPDEPLNAAVLMGNLYFEGGLAVRDGAENLQTTFSGLYIR
jgi:hypothetical protein